MKIRITEMEICFMSEFYELEYLELQAEKRLKLLVKKNLFSCWPLYNILIEKQSSPEFNWKHNWLEKCFY